MKIWAIIKKNNKIVTDRIFEDPESDVDKLIELACEVFDIGRPMILKKNWTELMDFNRTVFYQADFVEVIRFDTFEIEIVDEEKNKKTEQEMR